MTFHAALTSRARLGWVLTAWVAWLVEMLFYTFLRDGLGPYWSPVVIYGAAVLLCGAAARLLLGYDLALAPATRAGRAEVRRRMAGGALVVGSSLLLTAPVLGKLLREFPLESLNNGSDILTALHIYVERFLGPDTVYQPITIEGYGYSFLPNYPPLQWLPFVGAEWLGLDYRWWAYGLLLLGLLAYQHRLARLPMPRAEWLLKAALPVLILHFDLLVRRDALTVEWMIVGFYCVLLGGLLSRSILWPVVGLTLCLLSRYSLALWVPLYGVLLLWESPRRAVAVSLLTLVLSLVLFAPFLWHDPTIFLRAQLENWDVALGEWQHLVRQADGWERPYHLFNGVGLASWFYDLPGTLADRLLRLQTTHLAVCAAVSVVSGGLFWRYRRRFDSRAAAVLSLKFYLATFYAFLIIPYAYLATVSLFASFFVLLLVSRQTGFLQPAKEPAAPEGTE